MFFQYAVVNWAWLSIHHHARSLAKKLIVSYIKLLQETADKGICCFKKNEKENFEQQLSKTIEQLAKCLTVVR